LSHSPSLSFLFLSFFLLNILPPPRSPLFPYTTLFRSDGVAARRKDGILRNGNSVVFVLAVLVSFLRVAVQRTGAGERQKPALHRSEEHTSELQSRFDLVCRLLLEKKKQKNKVPAEL